MWYSLSFSKEDDLRWITQSVLRIKVTVWSGVCKIKFTFIVLFRLKMSQVGQCILQDSLFHDESENIIPLKVIKSSNQAISLPNTTYNQNCYRDWRFLNCLFSMLLTSTKNTYSHHMKTALPARLLVWSSCETLSSCLSPFFSNQVPWGTFLASVHQYFKLHHGYMRQKEMETG